MLKRGDSHHREVHAMQPPELEPMQDDETQPLSAAFAPATGHTTSRPKTPPPPPRPPTPDSFVTPHKLLRRNHFWIIHQHTSTVTTTHGKGTGNQGRSTTRNFTSPDSAAAWCKSIWREKAAQGYMLEQHYVHLPSKKEHDKPRVHRPSRKRVRPSQFAPPPPSPPPPVHHRRARNRGRGRGRAQGARPGRGRARAPGVLRGAIRKRAKGTQGGTVVSNSATQTPYQVALVRLSPELDETIALTATTGGTPGAVLFTQTAGETGREPVVETVEFSQLEDAADEFRKRYKSITACDWPSDGGAGWRVIKPGAEKQANWLYQMGQWHPFGDESRILERLHGEYQCNPWLRQRSVWTSFGGVILNLEDMTVTFANTVTSIRRVEDVQVETDGQHVDEDEPREVENVDEQVDGADAIAVQNAS